MECAFPSTAGGVAGNGKPKKVHGSLCLCAVGGTNDVRNDGVRMHTPTLGWRAAVAGRNRIEAEHNQKYAELQVGSMHVPDARTSRTCNAIRRPHPPKPPLISAHNGQCW